MLKCYQMRKLSKAYSLYFSHQRTGGIRMARFCFVSYAQPGHLDFGGMSYVRTAVELKKRGHEVEWQLSFYPILSRYQREDHFIRASKIVKSFKINVKEYNGLHTKLNQKSNELLVINWCIMPVCTNRLSRSSRQRIL